MKSVLNWIKANPITVASLVVVIVSLAFIGWVQMKGAALTEEMASRQSTLRRLRGLIDRSVELPPKEADGQVQNASGTINPVAIEQITALYDRMHQEYREIFQQAIQINRGGHETLVEDLFPTTNNAAKPFLARDAYNDAFAMMLQPYPPDAERRGLPRLDAGMPPTSQEISEAVARVEADFRSSPAMAGQQLTPDDTRLLRQEQRARAIEMLNALAQSIHIYAASDRAHPQYPFQIMPWADSQQQPTESQLWEGQLELWIQEDLVRAIALTNDVTDPNSNVINAPVKRLISVQVLPGYVGLHTAGGLQGGQSGLRRPDGAYPPPLIGQTGSADSRVSDNFYVGPTGRVSNALYDVRHARLEIVVDYARLTELFNNLATVNFMTVLSVQFQDIDEYKALEEGYIYGSNDVVQATLLIETVWLRDWTRKLMPPLTRQYLGIDPVTTLLSGQDGIFTGFE